MLTLGSILNDFQADYIPGLTEFKPLKRSVSRVIDDLNSKMDGVEVFDQGLELIVASVTEDVTFSAANQAITVTTSFASSAEPGDVIFIYDSLYNNRAFTIGYQAGAVSYPIPSQPVFIEATVECTYAVYRPWRKKLIDRVGHTDLSYTLTGGGADNTLTSASLEIDFLEIGLKAGDLVLISGASETINNALFEVVSTTATVITTELLGKSGLMVTDANDIGVMTIFSSPVDAYSYDLENHRFSLPESGKQFQQVFEGNITTKIDPKSNAFVANTDNDDLEKFATTARNSYSLTTDLFTGAGDILTFRVRRDLVAPQSAYRDAEIDIPQAFEHALKKGVLADLLSLPKYSNADLLKDQRALYQGALAELFGSEESRNRSTVYEKDYPW